MPPGKRKIRLAVIGVGNVTSVLMQALVSKKIPGIWHNSVAGYAPGDIEIVGAFDVDRGKVGKDLADAAFEEPNVSTRFEKVSPSGIIVRPGLVADSEINRESSTLQDFASQLRETRANVALNLISSGMPQTSLMYAGACFESKCSLVNGTPARLASNIALRKKFAKSNLVLVGDDLLSQFGGTAFHKGILEFMNRRGLRLRKSYQLDVGGGSETLRTMKEEVKQEKRDIKTSSISEEIPYRFETVAGTTDYVDYLGNNRTSYFWIQAGALFDSEVKIDVYLRTNDGANATNVLLDVIRATAGCSGKADSKKTQTICDYGFKSTSSPSRLQKAQEDFVRIFSAK
jgi:myo-inositol-1-phosphate synthase